MHAVQERKLKVSLSLLFNLKKKKKKRKLYTPNPRKTRHHKNWMELTLAMPGVALKVRERLWDQSFCLLWANC